MKYAGGNKGQWFPTKKEHEGSGERWGLWCKKRADGRVQVSSVSGIGGGHFLNPWSMPASPDASGF